VCGSPTKLGAAAAAAAKICTLTCLPASVAAAAKRKDEKSIQV